MADYRRVGRIGRPPDEAQRGRDGVGRRHRRRSSAGSARSTIDLGQGVRRRGQGRPHPLLAERHADRSARDAAAGRSGLGGRRGRGPGGLRQAQGVRRTPQLAGRSSPRSPRRTASSTGLGDQAAASCRGSPADPLDRASATRSSRTVSRRATSSGPSRAPFGWHVVLFEDRRPDAKSADRRSPSPRPTPARTSPRSPRTYSDGDRRGGRRRSRLGRPRTSSTRSCEDAIFATPVGKVERLARDPGRRPLPVHLARSRRGSRTATS